MTLAARLGPHPFVGVSVGFRMLPTTLDGLRVVVVSFLVFHVRIAW